MNKADTVEEEFGCGNVSIWSDCFTYIVDFVTSNSNSKSIRVFFLWSVSDKNSSISCFFVGFLFGEIKLILFVTLMVHFLLPCDRRANLLNTPYLHSLYSSFFIS